MKQKIDWIGFFLNFLAVCLGIVITFAGQGMIDRRAERNEVKGSLLLVKNELLDNLSHILASDSILVECSDAARFLLKYEGRYQEAPKDSMAMYGNIPMLMFEITYSEEALELLKTSSLFSKIKDPNLSMSIIHTYGKITDEIRVVNYYHERKIQYLEEAMVGEVKFALTQDRATLPSVWTAITSTPEGKQFLRVIDRLQYGHDSAPVRESIQQTIDLIDNYR